MNHGRGVFPADSSGMPFNAASIAVSGDPIADLTEDLAAEQKARAVYDNILRVSDDPDVNDVIKFLRQREIVHFQRFGEPIHTNLRRFFPYQKCLDCSVQAHQIYHNFMFVSLSISSFFQKAFSQQKNSVFLFLKIRSGSFELS